MRGRVCSLLVQLLLGLASIVPRDLRPYFIVPIFYTPPNWRARSPYLEEEGVMACVKAEFAHRKPKKTLIKKGNILAKI
jgi:hypothetical protein